jgi:hypothetical protein
VRCPIVHALYTLLYWEYRYPNKIKLWFTVQ